VSDETILGTLSLAETCGAVRFEALFAADIDTLWAALTQPEHLGRWLGDFTGELRAGGTFTAQYFSSGWQGTGEITRCEAPHHFAFLAREADAPVGAQTSNEAWLSPEAGETRLVLQQDGLPPQWLAAFGAGGQTHFEDLAEHIAGRGRVDSAARFDALHPLYQQQLARLS
jgi:uncharacterized protein YndB with AHSA1/START domain